MNPPLTRFVGNRSPSIYGTITVDGVPVNFNDPLFAGASFSFRMRDVSSATLKVNDAAVIADPPGTNGRLRYDPKAVDVDTIGTYAAFWRVTLAGGVIFQETPEFEILIEPHAAEGNEYVSALELKDALGLQETQHANDQLADAVVAASRDVDDRTNNRFYLGASETLKFTAISEEFLEIPAAQTVSAVTAQGSALVLDTAYAVEGAPIQKLVSLSGYTFPRGIVNGVAVTGVFGWYPVPRPVKVATLILAARLVKRVREATFAVVGFALDGGAVRLPGTDADVESLLAPYTRVQY